jgi:ribosomal protein S18 acetylase RimI-like enzyme
MAEDFYITLTPVLNIKDAETVRTHRNACREFMTRNTDYISADQQTKWFNSLDKNNHHLFLLNKMYHGAVVVDIGYGYIRVEKYEVLLTGGITETERGKGHGFFLFERLVRNSFELRLPKYNLPIRLEVLKNNSAGIATYKKVGFKVINEDEKIYKMEYKV